jgi:hypothetical protein
MTTGSRRSARLSDAWTPLVLAAALAVLSACGNPFKKDIPQYACPKVLILGDAGTLVRFKPGPGRDITDIQFEARIVNFIGGCLYEKDGVDVGLNITIAVERGAAAAGSAIEFDYFVAIPEFRPKPEGKRILNVKGEFTGSRPRLFYQDKVDLFIPLSDGATGPQKEIVLGFQLTPAEVAYNRSVRRR